MFFSFSWKILLPARTTLISSLCLRIYPAKLRRNTFEYIVLFHRTSDTRQSPSVEL